MYKNSPYSIKEGHFGNYLLGVDCISSIV